MPYLTESEILRKIKFRRLIREHAGSNQNKFAQITGIQQSQISQMAGPKREISDKMWARVIESLGIIDQALPEDYEQLRQEMEVTKNMVHQGKQLEEYMVRHGIKNIDAAAKLGVSPAMVSIYKSSEQFRPDVAEKINKLLSVNEDPVLYGNASDSGSSLRDLPLISDSLRNLTDLAKCPRYEISPKLEYNLKDGVVIRVDTDSMEPTIKKDSELLGIAVPPEKYKYHTGLTAIHYADMVAIGEVQSNDILDKGYITLAEYVKRETRSMRFLTDNFDFNLCFVFSGKKQIPTPWNPFFNLIKQKARIVPMPTEMAVLHAMKKKYY